MKTTITTFKERASYPQHAVVMIFDLEGFSKFFSQPDVQDYVTKYLNIVFSAVETITKGGEAYWMPKSVKNNNLSVLPSPIHSKFLGDGGLYIWNYNDFTSDQLISFVNRLYNLRLNFEKILEKAVEEVPVIDIPKNIRFGVSAGSVLKLNGINNNREEFIGYSINLAARLQSYCREIGFIVSGRLNIKTTNLEKHQYVKQIAIAIKGFPQEIVIIDKDDLDLLDDDTKNSLFVSV